MEAHLVLKENPEDRPNPVFLRSKDENKIVFPKFQTQFDFKSISYPNDDIFSTVTLPLIRDKFFKGEDSLLLTLGPTNSGKSHLFFKSDNSIIIQSLKYIFDNIEPLSSDVAQIRKYYPNILDARIPDKSCDVSHSGSLHLSVSVFELYNDNIIDLLNQTLKTTPKMNSTIVTDPTDSKLTPRNLTKCLVNSYDSTHNVIFNALSKRKTSPTFTNNESSRSHCFIFLNLHKIYGNVIETTRLTFVDLAGLERSKSAKTSGLSLREASCTNGSLTELGRCLELISMNQLYRTCLRTNKLTRLVLNDYVRFNHPVHIIVTLDPFGEEGLILQTLRYIDPIRYQHLQRRSLLHSRPRSRNINENEQKGLINEIDKLRHNQRLLKNKISNLEESIIENESNLKNQLYKENEKNISEMMMNHKEEINLLTQKFRNQTDSKLQDQLDSFKLKLDEAQNIINNKNSEIDLITTELNDKKEELNSIKMKYSEISTVLNNLKLTNIKEVNDLNTKLEEVNKANEYLKKEIEVVTVKITELNSNHKEELKSLEINNNKIINELKESLSKSSESYDFLKSELNTSNNELHEKIIQNNILLDDKNALNSKLSSLKADLESKNKTISEMKEENEHKIKELVDSLSLKESELFTISSQIDILKSEISSQTLLHRKDNEQKDAHISELKSQCLKLQQSLTSSNQENQTLKSKLEENNDISKTTVEFLEKMVESKDAEISRIETQKAVEIEKYKISMAQKNSEIENLKSELENFKLSLNGKIEYIKQESEKKSKNLLKIIEEKENKLKQTNIDFSKFEKLSQQKAKEVELLLNDEIEKNKILKSDFEKLVVSKDEIITKLSKNIDMLNETIQTLESNLGRKDEELEIIQISKKSIDEELAKLQLECSDLKSELSEKEKIYERYVSLKTKNSEFSVYVKQLQSEKEGLSKELRDKDIKLSKYSEQIEKLSNKIASLEEQKIIELKRQSSADIDNAILSSGEGNIDKIPRESFNILDTDPLDDIGLPTIMSSPVKTSTFQIHSDINDKDNTITFGSKQPKKKKKGKKANKFEHSLNQKKLHEESMIKSNNISQNNKLKFNALVNKKTSDLNKRQSLPLKSNEKILRKRRTLSPVKTTKKKLRKSIGGDDSLENLE